MLYNDVRPGNWDQVVGQKEVVRSLRNQSKKNKFFQVYVLGGQFGSGKTTIARIIARAANCEHKDDNGNPCCSCPACRSIENGTAMDVVELDAASNTGVDAIRDLKETVGYRPVALQKKVYIIDEVHMLSNGAFNALLKVLEEPPKDVIFVLCTTEVKKIPATVRSRAACYQFSQITRKDMVPYLKEIAEAQHYVVSDDAIELIARNSYGAMRNALSLLEQAAQMGEVSRDSVSTMLGVSDPVYLFELMEALLQYDISQCIQLTNTLFANGKDPSIMVNDMLELCADCVMALNAGQEVVEGSEEYCHMVGDMVLHYAEEAAYCEVAGGLMSIRDELRANPEKTTLICGIMRMFSNGPGMPENASLVSEVNLLRKMVEGFAEQVEELKSQINGAVDMETVTGVQKEYSSDTEITEEDRYYSSIADSVAADSVEEGSFDMMTGYPVMEEEKTVTASDVSREEGRPDSDTEENSEPEADAGNAESDVSDCDAKNNCSFGSFGSLGAFLDMFGNDTDAGETPKDALQEQEPVTRKESVSSIGEVEEYITGLCEEQHVIGEMIRTAFEKTVEGDKIVFTTTQAPVYRLMQAREKILEPETGFPFEYRLKEC